MGLGLWTCPAGTNRVDGFDSAAIEQALSLARAGDAVELPAGVFTLTRPLQLRSGVRLLGVGAERTRIRFAAAKPGDYFVTLVVWDEAGRGGRAEKRLRVVP